MPTPFMHLQAAERMRACFQTASKGRSRPQWVTQVEAAWPAFYAGSVAPDFQSICDVPRAVPHFYPIPPEPNDYEAFERMLNTYPQLATASKLPPAHAVFVAAYGAHLLYDLIWDHQVLTPYFRNTDWGEPIHRFKAHNILLTFLDKEAHAMLPPTAAQTLAAANPTGWLPFAPDNHLLGWQQMLVEQLKPGVPIRTIEIYAHRLRIQPELFATYLENPDWLDENVYQRVSMSLVYEVVEKTAVAKSVALIQAYLSHQM